MDLLDVAEAQKRLLSFFTPLSIEHVSLEQGNGRVLAEDIFAPYDLPLFSNSEKDGFAVRASDLEYASLESAIFLEVIADIPAGGACDCIIQQGQAARIMTGAPIPEGADAVVPVEWTDVPYRQPGVPLPKTVNVYQSIELSENIRNVGEDVRQGDLVLRAGKVLRSKEIGFLGMLGITNVPVHQNPRVAILSVGDELLPPHLPLEPGKIHDANSYTLSTLVESAGGEPVQLGIVGDQYDVILKRLDQAVNENVDLIISSAGVSVGAFDYVRNIIENYGKLDFWRVNMRPGKPLAFGNFRGVPFIGLPGNPVSAFVGFEVFIRPALAKLTGNIHWKRQTLQVKLAESVQSDGRESYLRAIVTNQNDQIVARLTGHQGSGNLRSLVDANTLLVIPSGLHNLVAGAIVTAWPIGEI